MISGMTGMIGALRVEKSATSGDSIEYAFGEIRLFDSGDAEEKVKSVDPGELCVNESKSSSKPGS